MAGILVPLFIHLWNVKKGKTLKVGSVAFLTETARTHSKSLRVSDWPLLLLRCLLLILLALLIAGAFFEKQDNAIKEKGWVLIDKNDLNGSYKAFGHSIDSLSKAGFVIHFFNKGFAEGSLGESSGNDTSQPTISYWTLLKELDQQVPEGLPLYLFTNNRLNHIRGERPSVALDLHWKTYASPDTSFLTSKQVDTTAISVCIYADKPGMGENYVKAALEAIRDAGKQKIKIITAATIQNIPKDISWLFWLSENKMPASLTNASVFTYQSGKVNEVSSPLISTGKINVAPEEDFETFKNIRHVSQTNSEPLWTNGYGETVLGKEGRVYHFYSRFDPQWSTLAWNTQFPQLIYALISGRKGDEIDLPATTPIDHQQLQPAKKTDTVNTTKSLLLKKTDLSKVLWILAFIIFFLERLLTYHKRKEVVYE